MTESKKQKFHLTVSSKTSNLKVIRTFIKEIALHCGFSEEDTEQIELAVDEASTNVIRHAHQYNPEKYIHINVTADSKKLSIQICDKGKGFNVKHIDNPDLKKYIREAKKGGLGIHLMRKLMDDVSFSSTPQSGHCVALIKYIKKR